MNMKEMGLRIKLTRKERNVTAEKLAEMVGVSVQTISNIENGRKGVSLKVFFNICKSLKISSDYLLFGKLIELIDR